MKILYIITGLGQGGAERVVCDLADKMYEKGHEIKIVYLTGEVLTYPSYKEIELIKVNLNDIRTLILASLKLMKVVKRYQPDIVHSHMVHANILSRLIRLVVPMNKLISTAHSSNEGGNLRMLAYRLTHHLADITTNVSKEAAFTFEEMKAVPKNGMLPIYNGIDLEKFTYNSKSKLELSKELGINTNCKIILAVGRFNEEKDYPNLLQAIKSLKLITNFSFKLVIVGDGILKPLIKNIIDELDLQDDVILLGRRSDIPALMSAADLFVLSSKYEGFGLVVAEAIACECLVVATNAGGVAEVLNNPEFLVPPSDSVTLANRINYALTINKQSRERAIKKNMQHVQDNFSLKNIADKWADLYHEI